MSVVQVVVAAINDPLAVMGDQVLSWEAVTTTLIHMAAKDRITAAADRILTNFEPLHWFALLRSKFRPETVITLEDLFLATENREASDPRDHIYSLLGLISDPRHETFDPNYAFSATVAYQQAMISIFKSRQDLCWLTYASGGGHATFEPSWGADFSSHTWTKIASLLQWKPPRPSEFVKLEKSGASAGKGMAGILNNYENGLIKLIRSEVGCIRKTVFMSGGVEENSFAYPSIIDGGVKRLLHNMEIFTVYAHEAFCNRLGLVEAGQKLAAGAVWKVAARGVDFDDIVGPRWSAQLSSPDGYALLTKVATRFRELNEPHQWADLLREEPENI